MSSSSASTLELYKDQSRVSLNACPQSQHKKACCLTSNDQVDLSAGTSQHKHSHYFSNNDHEVHVPAEESQHNQSRFISSNDQVDVSAEESQHKKSRCLISNDQVHVPAEESQHKKACCLTNNDQVDLSAGANNVQVDVLAEENQHKKFRCLISNDKVHESAGASQHKGSGCISNNDETPKSAGESQHRKSRCLISNDKVHESAGASQHKGSGCISSKGETSVSKPGNRFKKSTLLSSKHQLSSCQERKSSCLSSKDQISIKSRRNTELSATRQQKGSCVASKNLSLSATSQSQQRCGDPSQDRTQNTSSGRVLRNRQYKRAFSHQRDSKRLFTPEIKSHLKDWLIRRRVHPYPNRAEKRGLAQETGLTYIQICNWFANWRRKLKSVSADDDASDDGGSWSHRIVTYNERAEGNVEQLSIASEDSIWEGGDAPVTGVKSSSGIDHSYSSSTAASMPDDSQCLTVSSTTCEAEDLSISEAHSSLGPDKSSSTRRTGKRRGEDDEGCRKRHRTLGDCDAPVLLSKWRTSVANFQPAVNNYTRVPTWTAENAWPKKRSLFATGEFSHQRAELEAAEALTRLARLHH